MSATAAPPRLIKFIYMPQARRSRPHYTSALPWSPAVEDSPEADLFTVDEPFFGGWRVQSECFNDGGVFDAIYGR
jgi:ABC-type sulfate transport system substrate-binding protein